MFRFSLTRPDGDETVIILANEQAALTEVFERFEDFLRGCGYTFEGRIDIVSDDEAGPSAE